MSAAADLVHDLAARGFQLTSRGDRLRVRAPRGALTPELRDTLAANKPAILALLAAEERRATARPVLHFRITGAPANAWATLIGRPGESTDALHADLQRRFGALLLDVQQPATAPLR